MYTYAIKKTLVFQKFDFLIAAYLYEFEIISNFWLQQQRDIVQFFLHLHIYDEKWTAWATVISFSPHLSQSTLFEQIDFLTFHTEEYIFRKEYAYIYVWGENIGFIFFSIKIPQKKKIDYSVEISALKLN